MDFSELLIPYASEDIIQRFKEHQNDAAVSSLLLNPKAGRESLDYFKEDIKKDSQDELLYRFSKDTLRLGKSVEHFAGAFYLMDPSSAMISYYLKDLVKESPNVIDLCAAPGGKSIAFSFRRPDAMILSNDIAYNRALEIVKNTDRLGISNVLTMSMDPMKIPEKLNSSFDLVILDAPCSGSGMIRKDIKMKEDWSEDKVKRLLPIQENLLSKAYDLVKKDGIICYSTCSLSIDEDEQQIENFLNEHKDVEEIKLDIKDESIVCGKYGYHMIPGIFDGEGIYFSILRKTAGDSYSLKEIKYKEKSEIPNLHAVSYKKNQFLLNRFYSEFEKLPFIVIGTKINDLTEHPKCPFDHSYCKVASFPLLSLSREEAICYANGEEIRLKDNKEKDGLMIASYQNLRLGFGKKVKNRFKNYLPKGLRADLI